jgi:hypothetical protein
MKVSIREVVLWTDWPENTDQFDGLRLLEQHGLLPIEDDPGDLSACQDLAHDNAAFLWIGTML